MAGRTLALTEPPRSTRRRAPSLPAASALDRVIHEPMRLAIVSALAAQSVLSFAELKALLKASDGNLSAHARKLEFAGYLRCRKSFDGRVPRTAFSLTPAGRRALKGYVGQMEGLLAEARTAIPSAPGPA